MNQEKRLIAIKKLLKEKHQLSTRQLAAHFGVAFDTARRDILRLTSTGQAVRIHGGLMAVDQSSVPDFLVRSQIQSPVKEKMAKIAKKFVHPGQLDFFAPSTTVEQLCSLINGIDLKIVTNSIDNAYALINTVRPQVMLLGGDLSKKDHFTASSAALAQINRLYFNTAFIGTSKVRADGIYTVNQTNADIIQAVVSHSKQVILFAEKYKFTNHHSSPYLSTPLDQIDVVITDASLNTEYEQYFKPKTRIISVLRKEHHDQHFNQIQKSPNS